MIVIEISINTTTITTTRSILKQTSPTSTPRTQALSPSFKSNSGMTYFDPITLSAISKPSSSPLPFKKYSPQQLLNNNNNRLPNSSISPLQSIMGITTMSSL